MFKGKIKEIKDAIEKAKSITPIAKKNGIDIVSFEDGVILGQLEALEGNVDTGERKFNPDGSLARSRYTYVCVNKSDLLNNRYRRVAGKKYQIVIDYRAINEQESGIIYAKNIVAYEIGKVDGVLKKIRTITVSADEFVSEFTHKLDAKGMAEIIPLLQNDDGNISEDKLDI